ncbi:type II secretion system minor pseudopilin GspK [Kordiimonas marina]|uniref:type II secretion system minor pseudopilin GspK n=1 Tax=Kordiimonas marina TaxID=2872312 RepID=UPI001FF5A98B|nr:type II secretion system minor pseudopilin GspK [Kordiimonas marina]MCJ9430052.1 type II secretion system minor pseudopilin GspK [Kordiimonas marina]
MKHCLHRLRNEQGVILIVVMMTVAIMAIIAVGLMEEVRFSLRLSTNAGTYDQERWYALDMEPWAQAQLAAVNKDKKAVTFQPIKQNYSLDGMQLIARLVPLSNCFNLNSLIATKDGKEQPSAQATRLYGRLLSGLGVSPERAADLIAALEDWIDSDTELRPGGAEDYEYSGLAIPYRTGNTRLDDVSELKSIKGYDASLYNRLQPFVCTLPAATPLVLDINSLTRADARLVDAVFDASPAQDPVEVILNARPAEGFADIKDLWKTPDLASIGIKEEDKALLTVKPHYFLLHTTVTQGDIQLVAESAYSKAKDAQAHLLWRRIGEE